MQVASPRNRILLATAGLVAVVALAAGLAGASLGAGRDDVRGPSDTPGHENYTIGLFGDMPYGSQGRAEYPRVLADLNDARLQFSIFDGDLKNGNERCDDSLYTTSLASFNTLERPVVWVPGDNDWTDCHRASNGNYDPIERLAHERQLFTSTDQSLGGKKTPTLARQLPDYPENVRWSYGPVLYVGLNVQGSNNNYPHAGVDGEPVDRGNAPLHDPAAEIAREDAEYQARNAADIQWLQASFAYAKQIGARGVLVVWQADPNFNNEMHLQPAQYDGFTGIVNALRTETIEFDGQVALVHGDSHYFKIDKPLLSASGKVLANFTRVETFGSGNNHWVAADVDKHNPNLFEFRPVIVPANAG
jgi:hypothetical protein